MKNIPEYPSDWPAIVAVVVTFAGIMHRYQSVPVVNRRASEGKMA